MSEGNGQTTAASLAEGWQHRSIEEALDEVAREIAVRERCFPRWITEGRISKSDAKDRLQRMLKAAFLLDAQVQLSTESVPAEHSTAPASVGEVPVRH